MNMYLVGCRFSILETFFLRKLISATMAQYRLYY